MSTISSKTCYIFRHILKMPMFLEIPWLVYWFRFYQQNLFTWLTHIYIVLLACALTFNYAMYVNVCHDNFEHFAYA